MMMLLSQGTERMSSIAANIGCTLPSAIGMIDRLVDKGLVACSEDHGDRREVMCRLTLHGEAEMAQFRSLNRLRYVNGAQT